MATAATTTTQSIMSIQLPRHALPITQKAPRGRTAPTPLVPSEEPFSPQQHRAARLRPIDPSKALASAKAKREKWAALNLKQEWADATFMRGHLRMAALRVNVSAEPATIGRMKALLRRSGVHSPEIQEAIGMPLAKFLKVNPRLPLWAALALVLESTGRFTPES